MADHIQGLLIPLGPTTPHHDGAIPLACDLDLFSRNEPPWLETRASRIKAKGLALPRRCRAHGRPAPGGPAQRLQCVLQRRPIAPAVTQQDDLGPLGHQRAQQRDHGDGESLGTMPFGTLAHAPRQGQRAPRINPVEHQCHAATADDTALHAHHQRVEGSLRQQEIDRGDQGHLLQDTRVVEPSGQAFDTALGLGALGDFCRDAGQLGALAPHDPTDERRKRGHVPGDCACGLTRIPLS